MKKRRLSLLFFVMSYVIAMIVTMIFMSVYERVEPWISVAIYSIGFVCYMYVAGFILNLFKDKCNKVVLRLIFILILLINIVVAIISFNKLVF